MSERDDVSAEDTWKMIHSERADLAGTLTGLTDDQWASQSWCEGWTVHDTAGVNGPYCWISAESWVGDGGSPTGSSCT